MMLQKIRSILSGIYLLLFIVLITVLAYSQSEPPENLEALVKGNTVTLTWKAPEGIQNITYNVYRAGTMNSGKSIDPTKLEFKKISTVIQPTYEDKDASSGITYIYYVVSLDTKGTESAGSNYINVRIGDTNEKKIKDRSEN